MTIACFIRKALPLPAAALALGLCVAQPAAAVVGKLDDAPAATLLLPYFEVDLDTPDGAQTRFTVNNVEAAPVLAHVTLWTDLAQPTYSFDVYVGGRDSVEVDLRLLFTGGVLPRTGPGQHPAGPFSNAQGVSCPASAASDFHPGVPVQLLPAASIAHLQNAHTGRATALAGNLCMGVRHADRIARGYVTIDTANTCGSKFPNEPGYFLSGGIGFASDRNALTGTFATLARGARDIVVSSLVHLEASADDPLTTTPGNYTFYSKLVANTAVDNREPVGTVWQARIFELPTLDFGGQVVAWRDAPVRPPFNCNLPFPTSVFPLAQAEIASFDEAEEVQVLNSENPYPNPAPPPILPFPFATQSVDAAQFMPWNAGFVQFNLNTFVTFPASSVPDLMQSWVGYRPRLGGAYGALAPATLMLTPDQQVNGAASCTGSIQSCSNRSPIITF